MVAAYNDLAVRRTFVSGVGGVGTMTLRRLRHDDTSQVIITCVLQYSSPSRFYEWNEINNHIYLGIYYILDTLYLLAVYARDDKKRKHLLKKYRYIISIIIILTRPFAPGII